MAGVSRRQMKCQGLWSSGTTFLIFENVKVPVENLIGKEGEAFKYIMYNFNTERLGILMSGVRNSRLCIQECMSYAHKRETFGKKLIEHPVIREKLAHMIRSVEATHAYIEQIVYNF